MQTQSNEINRIIANSDLIIAACVICIVMMMILPIPWQLLDVFLTFNISFALVILLVSMYTRRPLDFSIFPSLLLITTLLRLSLNVSSTRLVLLHAFAGKVIEKFGTFVVGGNTVVGLVIVLILVVIQFVVITRGAERVSEVAARFTLDAMPGKQMAIDADLNAGLINEEAARARRREIQREADFYGAMDGASKFVKGDAIAGIIIVIINIVGGLIIGMAQKGFTLSEAIQKYTILTVGDGLVTQIPALLISTATGIVVTRSASEGNLGRDLTEQLLSQPRVLIIAAGVLAFLGVLGLPRLPLFTMALIFALLYFMFRRGAEVREEAEEVAVEAQEAETVRRPENVMELLNVEKMELELGYSLIPLVDAEQGGDLLDRIVMIRRQCAAELGFIVPPIRIRDNIQLKPNVYVIKIKGLEVARAEVLVDRYLVIGPGIEEDLEVSGLVTKEPAFNMPAKWIDVQERSKAEAKGYTVVDPPSVVATHLTQLIRRHAHELLGRQEVQNMINYVKEQNPAVVEELVPDLLSVGEIQKVLANLLKEQVPIRDLVTILEALADHARLTKDPDLLTEYVRQSLKRHISRMYAEEGRLMVITLDPELEEYLKESVRTSEFGSYLAIEPERAQALMQRLAHKVEEMSQKGYTPVVVCAPVLRLYFKRLVERFIPHLVVLSYNEIESQVEISVVGMVAA